MIISYILMEEKETTACSSNYEITHITCIAACSCNYEMKAKGQLSRNLGTLRAGDQLVNGLLLECGGGLCTDDTWGSSHYINPTPELRSNTT